LDTEICDPPNGDLLNRTRRSESIALAKAARNRPGSEISLDITAFCASIATNFASGEN
jgi:hypothetical protein